MNQSRRSSCSPADHIDFISESLSMPQPTGGFSYSFPRAELATLSHASAGSTLSTHERASCLFLEFHSGSNGPMINHCMLWHWTHVGHDVSGVPGSKLPRYLLEETKYKLRSRGTGLRFPDEINGIADFIRVEAGRGAEDTVSVRFLLCCL